MGRGKKKRLPSHPVEAVIESLTHDGRGVTHIEGKAVFIDGALPGESIRFVYTGKHRRFDEGRVESILSASPDRVEARCPHFSLCGGCSLQHMAPQAQILAKQKLLLDNLQRIGHVSPERVLPPLTGPLWAYRTKARLGVKDVIKKGRLLVGFREKRKPYVAELTRCEVLHESVGLRLQELVQLIEGMQGRACIPQIEVAVGEDATALVFRHLEPLVEADLERLRDYAQGSGLHVLLQPGGPETITPLWPEVTELHYRLPEQNLELAFRPTDFTQINTAINRQMIVRALELLDPGPEDRVLDLFCGLGNFTLPLAQRAGHVVGVEGEAGLVQRARDNAARNGISNTEFYTANLMEDLVHSPWLDSAYSKILLDPPRSGAAEIIPQLMKLKVGRMVYVSCHPASLARDAGVLVNEYGYRLKAAGVMDMFPHTAHVESIALFEADGK